jgi:hypothetical protein
MRFNAGRPMRRAGPWRWGPRLQGPRAPLQTRALQALDRAHRLMNQGRPAEAAPIFAQLSAAADTHGMPVRAAHLQLQAARALAHLGDAPGGLARAQAALALLVKAGTVQPLRAAFPRFIAELQALGFQREAGELQGDVKAALGSAPLADLPAPAVSSAPPRLPAECPNCAGPVRSDEVEWIDAVSAACTYCGSILHTL